MSRAISSRVVLLVRGMLWLGRGTATVLGLAVILALMVGIASSALAGTGVGATFNLGKANTVNALSKLVGSTDNPLLRIVNKNTGTNATALDLQVAPGHAPMKVNSSTTVTGLNADRLDGRDAFTFMSSGIYKTEAPTDTGTVLGDGSEVKTMSCDPGDRLLSGGPASVAAGSKVLDSFPTDGITWQARIFPVSGGDSFTVVILCADQ